jgi:kynurenine formamidase
MSDHVIAGQSGVQEFGRRFGQLRNWGRWGPADQKGAVNLITPEKVQSAAAQVKAGVTISMSRVFPKKPAANNEYPAGHYMIKRPSPGGGGSAVDHLAISCHGQASTHLDALCHVWLPDGMWNGREADEEIGFEGARWGGIENWADGIITRGVLLDVAAQRAEGYVAEGEPVTADELRATAAATGVSLEGGDALLIHCGRDNWEAAHGRPYGSPAAGYDLRPPRPGLHASSLEFFFESDCAMIIWDMMDARPNEYGIASTVHLILPAQGVPLLDNASLGPVAGYARQTARPTCMVCVAPLNIPGGTGSPVNPLAVF